MESAIFEHDGEELWIYALSRDGVWLAIAKIDMGYLSDRYHFPMLLKFISREHLSMSKKVEPPDLEVITKSHSGAS